MGYTKLEHVTVCRGLSIAQRRTYWFIVLGLTSVVFLIASIAIPITLFQAYDNRQMEQHWRGEISETDRWASIFRGTAVDAIALTYGMEGFVLGSMTSIPPFNGTVEERLRGQRFERFKNVATKLNFTTPFTQVFILAPGGVISQTFPEHPSLDGYDFLGPENLLEDPTVIDSIDNAKVEVLGPLHQGSLSVSGTWQLVVRAPIYNVADIANASRESFWGFSLLLQDVDNAMDTYMIDKVTQRMGLDYLVYTAGRSPEELIPIRFSLKQNPTLEEMTEFISTGTNRTVLRNRVSWYICMRSRGKKTKLTRATIFIVVICAVSVALFIFLIGAVVILICLREYDGWSHAPKTTPFAIAIIGPSGGDQLWELAPEQMVQVSERLAAVQRRAIARHRAYEGLQVHPYTTTVIARTVESVLELCFDILSELQSQPIDGPLRELLGDGGRLLVACAVHWCTDAIVRMEAFKKSIRYEGPDVVYGGRMWVFSAPNAVCISNAARAVVTHLSDMKIRPLTSVFLRGVAERQDLFTITDPNNRRLQAALNVARERISSSDVSIIPTPGVKSKPGNPLSMSSEYTQHQGYFGAKEFHGPSGDCSSMFYSEAGCRKTEPNGVGIGCETGNGSNSMKGAKRTSDSSTGAKRPKPINVPKTLIELVSTEEMSPIQSHRDGNKCTSPLLLSDSHVKTLKCGCTGRRCMAKSRKSNRRALGKDHRSPPQAQGKGSNSNSSNNSSIAKESSLRNVHGVMSHSGSDGRESMVPYDGDFVTEELLRPKVPTSLDTHLRAVFERQALMLNLSYNSVRTIIYYFFSAFKMLLTPLAAPERSNIYHRFIMAFGIPQHDVLEHLAVRCVLRYIQQLEDTRSLLWNVHRHAQLQRQQQLPQASSPLVASSYTAQATESPSVDS